ncbi:MAG: SMP-30/gluconolactonase/LRE family protein [Burkholderiaceae bacterium]|nr:MAG: SMP-30/gluconolactonase/LRE family protein [Burkholderiaceae bacterium]
MDYIHALIDGSNGDAIPPLDGPLTPNDRLDAWEELIGPIKQPADVISTCDGAGLIYNDGAELYLWRNGDTLLLHEFTAPVMALTRSPMGSIVIACASGLCYRGAFAGATERNFTIEETVEIPHLAGATSLMCENEDGAYLTIGSATHAGEKWIDDLLLGGESGEIGYWRFGQGYQTLCSGLRYPAGIAHLDGTDDYWVSESWEHRILVLRGGSGGLRRAGCLLSNLSGYPGRLARVAGGYWLSIWALRTQLFEFVLEEKNYKNRMMQECPRELWIRPALASGLSNLEPLQYGNVRALGIEKPWAPPRSYGLLVRINNEGEVVESLHSRAGGRFHGLGTAEMLGNRLVVLARGARCIAIAPSDGDSQNQRLKTN